MCLIYVYSALQWQCSFVSAILFNTHFTEEGSQMLQSILFAALWSLALKESSSQCYWFDQLAERWKEGDWGDRAWWEGCSKDRASSEQRQVDLTGEWGCSLQSSNSNDGSWGWQGFGAWREGQDRSWGGPHWLRVCPSFQNILGGTGSWWGDQSQWQNIFPCHTTLFNCPFRNHWPEGKWPEEKV